MKVMEYQNRAGQLATLGIDGSRIWYKVGPARNEITAKDVDRVILTTEQFLAAKGYTLIRTLGTV